MKAEIRSAAFVVVLTILGGCGRVEDNSSQRVTSVYVDRETLQAMELARTEEAPAVNPQTGRRTLMPGLYCPQCKAWRPSPPLEVLQRDPQAHRCPKCQSPLTTDGPSLPADL